MTDSNDYGWDPNIDPNKEIKQVYSSLRRWGPWAAVAAIGGAALWYELCPPKDAQSRYSTSPVTIEQESEQESIADIPLLQPSQPSLGNLEDTVRS